MHSCLYAGQVRHRRLRPKANAFCYALFMPLLNLDELEQLAQTVSFFSLNQFNWAQFKRTDYLPQLAHLTLKQAVVQKLEELTDYRCEGSIFMLGQLRYLGVYFSPINCFYCCNSKGEVDYLLAEVSNTPWLEKHYYAVALNATIEQTAKQFHVSPFMQLEMNYRWRIRPPNHRLLLQIENHDDNGKLHDAMLLMRRQPLTERNWRRLLVRSPIITLAILGKIYWQALKLWLKGVPYVSRSSGVKHGS